MLVLVALTVQAQILRLMKRLVEERGSSLLLITHDFGVIAEMAQWIVVTHWGRNWLEAKG